MRDDFEKDTYGAGHLDYDDVQRIVEQKMLGSIGWMVLGLMLSGVLGMVVLTNENLLSFVSSSYYILLILEVAVVFGFSMMIAKASVGTLRMLFLIYAALNGLTLSIIGYIYTGESILYIFLGTVIYYASLATYGYVTKENLGKYTPYVFGALIALLVVSIVNFFMNSSLLYWMCSYAGVIIFSAFTAIDMNIIKRRLTEYALHDESMLNRIQIAGALNLYLDFVNLFLYLLRIFGKKR